MIHSHKDYAANADLAIKPLGDLLGMGCLNLFLGAGISKGFGLPEWLTLIGKLLGKDSDAPYMDELAKKSSGDQIKLVDPIDDGSVDYFEKVHAALYYNVAATLPDQLTRSPLLLAVAALLTGSCRGRIGKVFTYNYDNLLEQYLGLLGQSVCIRTAPTDYSTWSDVEINHVHGFLPQTWTKKDKDTEVILSARSYRHRRSEIDKGWSAAVESSLYSKAALFMGLSGDDESMLDIFERAKPLIKRVEDYHGYWLMTPDAYTRNHSSVLDVGMCPIPIPKEELPRFVFAVCRAALR